MSSEQSPTNPPTPPRKSRHPVLIVLMVLGGIVLLLPGVCAIVFMTMGGMGRGDSTLVSLWFVCFLVSAGGVVLIVKAFR